MHDIGHYVGWNIGWIVMSICAWDVGRRYFTASEKATALETRLSKCEKAIENAYAELKSEVSDVKTRQTQLVAGGIARIRRP